MPSLGNLLLEGKAVIFTAWWMTFFPGVAIIAADPRVEHYW
jgi:peptide/nickel transport system permease protein